MGKRSIREEVESAVSLLRSGEIREQDDFDDFDEGGPPKTGEEFEELLTEVLYRGAREVIRNIHSYKEVGMLTTDAGLLVKLTNGTAFAVTIQIYSGRV